MITHFGNGSCKMNDKVYPIVWTGQFAQHVADSYYNEKPAHTLLHVEIQQALQKATFFKKETKTVYLALLDVKDGVIWIYFEKHSKYVSITTGFKTNSVYDKIVNHVKKGGYDE